jgi:hypothetical protein
MRIIETDNFGRDYPDEKFLPIPSVPASAAAEIAEAVNKHCSGDNAPRYWRVVPDNYKLQPGFEP